MKTHSGRAGNKRAFPSILDGQRFYEWLNSFRASQHWDGTTKKNSGLSGQDCGSELYVLHRAKVKSGIFFKMWLKSVVPPTSDWLIFGSSLLHLCSCQPPLSGRKIALLFWMPQEVVGFTTQNPTQALSSSKRVGSEGGRSKVLFLWSATLSGVFQMDKVCCSAKCKLKCTAPTLQNGICIFFFLKITVVSIW